MKLVARPLKPNRWEDFEILFGSRGACGGCWCMWWRSKRSEYEKSRGNINKRKMKKLVDGGIVPGLLFYENKKPIAWCSVSPRKDYLLLENSRVLRRVDEKPVWSIVCFYVDKSYRKKGLITDILKEIVKYVKKKKGEIVEGYPIKPKKNDVPAPFAWTGLVSSFIKAGFVEIARRSESRPIMRYYLEK